MNISVIAYMPTARNILGRDTIILNCTASYTHEKIYAAKEQLFSFFNIQPVKRRGNTLFTNAATHNLDGILQKFDEVDEKNLPPLVLLGYNTIPSINYGL